MGRRLARGVASGLRPRVIFLEFTVLDLDVGRSCFNLLVHVDVGARFGVLRR